MTRIESLDSMLCSAQQLMDSAQTSRTGVAPEIGFHQRLPRGSETTVLGRRESIKRNQPLPRFESRG